MEVNEGFKGLKRFRLQSISLKSYIMVFYKKLCMIFVNKPFFVNISKLNQTCKRICKKKNIPILYCKEHSNNRKTGFVPKLK